MESGADTQYGRVIAVDANTGKRIPATGPLELFAARGRVAYLNRNEKRGATETDTPSSIAFEVEECDPPSRKSNEVAMEVPINISIQLDGEETAELQQQYQEARDRYVAHTTALVTALRDYGFAKTAIDEARATLRRYDAQFVAEGNLDGLKNEREREAAIEMYHASDNGYSTLLAFVATRERSIAIDLSPQIELAKYLRRLDERDLEYFVATLQMLAGIAETTRERR